MEEPILDVVVSEDPETLEQLKLTVHEFREAQYLSLRYYYMDYDGEHKPTNKGVNLPITINNIVNIFDGLVELLSKSDVLHIILENSDSDTLRKIFTKELNNGS